MKLQKRGGWQNRNRIRKAQPTASDVHISQPLTNVTVAYLQSDDDYIATKVFPAVPVNHQYDQFYEFNKNDFFRDEAQVRAPGTESAGGGFNLSQDNYRCIVRAYHKDIDDQTRANADSQLQLDMAASEFVAQKFLISQERLWHNAYFQTGVWTGDVTPANLWDASNGTPRTDIDAGKAIIKGSTSKTPNTMVVPYSVYLALRSNADIRDQFKYTSAKSITADMMATYFDVDQFLISGAVAATNIEGAADNTAFIAGNNVLLCYTTNRPGLMTATAGYTFVWSGYQGAVQGARIKKFRMEPIESDRVEGSYAIAQHVVGQSLGYFLAAVIS